MSQWYTPPEIVEFARFVLGSIELDPASHEVANQIVKADRIFDGTESNGLCTPWSAKTVFCNPPYSKKDGGPAGLWVRKAVYGFMEEQFESGILLVNATTDRTWFRALWQFDICFLFKRIRFLETILAAQLRNPELLIVEDPPGFASGPSPTHGSALVLLTKTEGVRGRFVTHGSKLGKVIEARDRG
jgi:hypothetical protein